MQAPPPQTLLIRMLLRSFRWTMQLGTAQACAIVAGGLAGTLLIDWLTGPLLSMTMFYVAVDCFAAWTLRERIGVGVVLVSVALSSVLNGFATVPGIDPDSISGPVMLWNTATRALTAMMIVLMVATLRHLVDRERWRASTDYLTRSLNGGAFRAEIERVARAGRRRGATLLLLYMDLDGFKAVNDQHGHAAGDKVLRRFADEARARMRPADLFARLGGDEFCAFIAIERDADPERAIESLHARLSESLHATGFNVTCSMGAVIIDSAAAGDTERLIELADAAMMEAKRNGKDAIRIAFDTGPESRRAA